MQLSKNFHLREFSRSSVALRLDIDNTIPQEYIPNIQDLVDMVLQPMRDTFGPVIITSGYRCVALNGIIGGSPNSEHCLGRAADFIVPNQDKLLVVKWIKDYCDFNQLILEFHDTTDPDKGWIHCSYSIDNARQVLTATKENGKTVYKPGFPS